MSTSMDIINKNNAEILDDNMADNVTDNMTGLYHKESISRQQTAKPYGTFFMERIGFDHYFVLNKDYLSYEFELKMIVENKIEGLLLPEQKEEVLRYHIEDKKEFHKQFMEKKSDVDWIAQFLLQVILIIKKIRNYLLVEDSLILDPEAIFISSEHKVFLCYASGYVGNVQKEFCSLIEYLMRQIDHKNNDLVMLVYGLYHIVQEEQYSLGRVEDYIKECIQKKPSRKELEKNTLEEKICSYNDVEKLEIKENSDRMNAPEPERNHAVMLQNLAKKSKIKQSLIIIICGFIISVFAILYCYESIYIQKSNMFIAWLYVSLVSCLGCVLSFFVLLKRWKSLIF